VLEHLQLDIEGVVAVEVEQDPLDLTLHLMQILEEQEEQDWI
jgi:hypothetical protein